MRTNLASVILAVAGTVSAVGGARAGEPEYDLIVVPSFVNGYALAEAYLWDINESGVAAGTATIKNGNMITYTGMYWTEAGGKTPVPLSWPHGISNTGLLAGSMAVYDIPSGTLTNVPLLDKTYPPLMLYTANSSGIAAGYVQICNCSNSQGMLQIPYVWDAVNGARTLPVPNAKDVVRVSDADVAVGNLKFSDGFRDAFVYDLATGQYVLLAHLDPPPGYDKVSTTVADISDNGVVAGTRKFPPQYDMTAFTWTSTDGFTYAPPPGPGYHPDMTAKGINASGTVVGSVYLTNGSARAGVYDAANGTRDLNSLVQAPPGFVLMSAEKINDAGWIVGYGTGGEGGIYKAFVAKPRGAPCDADCDGSGSLDVDDFICFQTLFGLGDSGADCDQSGELDIDDLICFQTLFATGC